MRAFFLVLGLAACAGEDRLPQATDRGAVDLGAAPLVLTCSLLAPASPARCEVSGAPAGRSVSLAGGTPGTTCPSWLRGQCLSLRGPVLLGQVTADAAGEAAFELSLPGSLPQGADLVLQAVVLRPTLVSNALAARVYPALWLDGDAGQGHGCLLGGDGLPRCFGNSIPTPPAGVRFSALSAGQGGTDCGVTVDTEEVLCWGASSVLVGQVPAGPFVDVEVGGSHACAFDPAGTPTCWGSTCGAPHHPTTLTDVVDATAMLDGTCALTGAGTLACFGNWCSTTNRLSATPGTFVSAATSAVSAYAVGTTGAITRFVAPASGSNPYPGVPPAGTFEAVFAGMQDACALDAGGEATCWGRWLGATTPAPGPFEQVMVSNEGACGWSARGPARCWGTWPVSIAPELPWPL